MIGAGPMIDERQVESSFDRQESSFGFAAGLLTGLVCGGVLALLFAPKAGAELRGKLNESAGSMRDAMGRRYRDVAERASAGMGQVKEKAQGMAADARGFVQSKMQQGRDAAGQPTEH